MYAFHSIWCWRSSEILQTILNWKYYPHNTKSDWKHMLETILIKENAFNFCTFRKRNIQNKGLFNFSIVDEVIQYSWL